jgi:hypothetical protein
LRNSKSSKEIETCENNLHRLRYFIMEFYFIGAK